jgi:hypothetical protein
MKSETIVLPTIHLNGTGEKMLMEGYRAAYEACSKAADAFYQLEFNGRDYYPQGDGAWKKAHEEHCSRIARIDSVKVELLTIMMHIVDESDKRNALTRNIAG